MKKPMIIAAVIIAVLMVGVALFHNAIKPETYSTAKASSEKFLKRNCSAMEKIAVDLLNDGNRCSGYYQERYYSYMPEQAFVEFDIDAQGMLGGQYWSLIYTNNGSLWGETDEYLDEETDGNNIYRGEKLDGNWWFFWIDYDGTDRSYK